MKNIRLSISIVSHNQAELAKDLINDLSNLGDTLSAEILFTVNIDESIPFTPDDYHHPIEMIRNESPKGFGANHNLAFKRSRGRYFCVLNPDIRLVGDPFETLIRCLNETKGGVAAPRIINPKDEIENSARRFPTPISILKKALIGSSGLDYPEVAKAYKPDWIGGMFMLFARTSFEAVQGFDEGYFLYYEDVDICARLKMKDLPVIYCSDVKAIHDGRAESHHNLKYAQWHLRSMVRFFTSTGFFKLVLMPRLWGK
jgi:GT2 family glycosyltransferase